MKRTFLAIVLASTAFGATAFEYQCKIITDTYYETASEIDTQSFYDADEYFDEAFPIYISKESKCQPSLRGLPEVPDIADEGDKRTVTQRRGNVETVFNQVYTGGRWTTKSVSKRWIDLPVNKDQK